MRTFVRHTLAFLGIQAAILGAIVGFKPPYDSFYLAATHDKHSRLEHLQPPRVIFVGGSSMAFGLDGSRAEQRLKRPVVNMGLHAGLGLPFMLAEVLPYLREGDTVVLSPEYAHFVGPKPSELLNLVLLYRPESLAYVTTSREWKALFDDGLCALGQVTRQGLRGIRNRLAGHGQPGVAEHHTRPYFRDAFNEYGDVVWHWSQGPSDIFERYAVDFNASTAKSTVQQINRFWHTCQAMQVKVFYVFPAYARGSYEPYAHEIGELARYLHENLECPILGAPEDSVYDDDLFYDTSYHLTRGGAQRRTDTVVDMLLAQ